VEENTILVKEDETKDEGIFMMPNECITLDNDMVWYLNTTASNHMCGHKHLFVVSFEDSMKVPKMEKKVLWRMSIMYMT